MVGFQGCSSNSERAMIDLQLQFKQETGKNHTVLHTMLNPLSVYPQIDWYFINDYVKWLEQKLNETLKKEELK